MGRHHDQVGFFLLSRLHNCLCRVAVDQHATNGKAIQFRPKRLVLVLLRSSNDLGEHIPVSEFRPPSGTPAAWLCAVTTCSITISEWKWRANAAA